MTRPPRAVLAAGRNGPPMWIVLFGVCALAGCITPAARRNPAAAPTGCTACSLPLPPTPTTEGKWLRMASSDSCSVRWMALVYLLDLRDCFAAYDGLGDPSHRSGQSATAQVWPKTLSSLLGRSVPVQRASDVDPELQAKLDALSRTCPGFATRARAVRALLAADAMPRKAPAKALAAAVSYKRVLRAHPRLAPNARLRLVKWCSDAFHRAVRAEPSAQQSVINQCLFPLFEADPRPYFRDEPSTRPIRHGRFCVLGYATRRRSCFVHASLTTPMRRALPMIACSRQRARSYHRPLVPTPSSCQPAIPGSRWIASPWSRSPLRATSSTTKR